MGCAASGLVAEDRLTRPEQWEQHWSSIPLPYRIDLRSYRWESYDRLLRRLVTPGPGRFLEVGCGACQWLDYFQRQFRYEVYGLDYSASACRIGRANLDLLGTRASVVCGDAMEPPFSPGSFDVVFSDGVIEHFRDYAAVLRAMAELVRPGGILIATLPNFAGWFGAVRKRLDPELFDMHEPISAAALGSAIAGLHFENVEVGHLGSFRFPYSAIFEGTSFRRYGLAPIRLAGRVLDRLLRTAYRLAGRGIESDWLSSELYAVGRRPAL